MGTDYNSSDYSSFDYTGEAPEPRTGFHPVNIGHLVMGVAFAVMAVVWALLLADVIETRDLRWLMPAPWLAAGAAGLAALLLRRSTD